MDPSQLRAYTGYLLGLATASFFHDGWTMHRDGLSDAGTGAARLVRGDQTLTVTVALDQAV